VRITVAQLDPIVGDIRGNVAKAAAVLASEEARTAELVVFPELFLTGYPPKDLLEHRWFIRRAQKAVEEMRDLSRKYSDVGILFGVPLQAARQHGKGLSNAAVLLSGGRVVGVAHKALLPTYDVFDEARYFDPASDVRVIPFKGERLGVHICEDAWADTELWARPRLYSFDPVRILAEQGATLLINISSSPFHMGKEKLRFQILRHHAQRYHLPFLYVNQVGGNDELVFDGRSMCLDAGGEPIAILPSFRECVMTVDMAQRGIPGGYAPQDEIASVYDALVLGLRDYFVKCGFSQAVIGLSGGIDSSVTCCLAVEALGKENVLGVSMPSPYSSKGSIEDARQLAQNLGIGFKIIPISGIFAAYLDTLAEHFAGTGPNVAEENIQARIRGNILMALSNKFGYLVLSTGNKSELAVGYCTLYGDMSGGLAVISDVPKTMVYKLAAYINRHGEVIPQACIDKPPSAELKPNQVDQDTLPPYPILDEILYYYIEEGYSADEIIAQGLDEETVRWVVRTVARNEYKRKQAPPGLRVTSKAFGTGRRMPIAAKFEI